jgi:transcriptional regulator with XRE-family HTH domain
MPPLKVRLAQTIRTLRKGAGFSQEDFAAHIGVHRTFMSSIERGRVNISLETLERVAEGLRMSSWELLRIGEVGGGATDQSRDTVRRQKPGERRIAEDRDR